MDAKDSQYAVNQAGELTLNPANQAAPCVRDAVLNTIYNIPADAEECRCCIRKDALDLAPDPRKKRCHAVPC